MALIKRPLSKKQLEANRRNARRCTGPRTPAGKARSRLNALKHGRHAALLAHYARLGFIDVTNIPGYGRRRKLPLEPSPSPIPPGGPPVKTLREFLDRFRRHLPLRPQTSHPSEDETEPDSAKTANRGKTCVDFGELSHDVIENT